MLSCPSCLLGRSPVDCPTGRPRRADETSASACAGPAGRGLRVDWSPGRLSCSSCSSGDHSAVVSQWADRAYRVGAVRATHSSDERPSTCTRTRTRPAGGPSSTADHACPRGDAQRSRGGPTGGMTVCGAGGRTVPTARPRLAGAAPGGRGDGKDRGGREAVAEISSRLGPRAGPGRAGDHRGRVLRAELARAAGTSGRTNVLRAFTRPPRRCAGPLVGQDPSHDGHAELCSQRARVRPVRARCNIYRIQRDLGTRPLHGRLTPGRTGGADAQRGADGRAGPARVPRQGLGVVNDRRSARWCTRGERWWRSSGAATTATYPLLARSLRGSAHPSPMSRTADSSDRARSAA